MLSESLPNIKSSHRKSLGDYYNSSEDLDKKYIAQWSPQEDNKMLYKQRYFASARSVPHRNRRLAKYRISRSLNFDANLQNSSSDNSSFEGEKHLSRSAKIMRALNLNTTPTFYGKTKTKKSLNFNSTPSPKRFSRTNKSIKKPLNLSATMSPGLSKVLHYDESPIDSASSSIVFTSPESMDENQNETPSQQRFKAHTSLSYSTPNTKFNLDSPVSTSFSPLLRNGLKEKIDNIIYIDTPNAILMRSSKDKQKAKDDVSISTPRNLLNDFCEDDNGRPSTPENIIRLLPESMSAIKRSHKKERSRRVEKSTISSADSLESNVVPQSTEVMELLGTPQSSLTPSQQIRRKYPSSLQDMSGASRSCKKSKSWVNTPNCKSDGNASDTGSIFDYADDYGEHSQKSNELMEHEYNDSREISKGEEEILKEVVDKLDNAIVTENNNGILDETDKVNESLEIESNQERPTTPVALAESPPNAAGTPENRINYLQRVMKDSIKKSHRKIKDDNRKRLFSPLVLHHRLEAITPGKKLYSEYNVDKDKADVNDKPAVENPNSEPQSDDRVVTPERINSSRLLLSQFSSVKKSHRKDKHNKMLCDYKRRQECFKHDINGSNKTSSSEQSTESLFPPTTESSLEISSKSIVSGQNSALDTSKEEIKNTPDKVSPTKRNSPAELTSDSEVKDCSSPTDGFKIFTPLKRLKSITSPIAKGYVSVYQVPSGKDDVSDEASANLSRCLTPVTSFHPEYIKSPTCEPLNGCDNANDSIESIDTSLQELNPQVDQTQDQSGRWTPQNMLTTELVSGLDSIKKSHKKNKRSYRLSQGLLSKFSNDSGGNEEENTLETKANGSFTDNLPLDNNLAEKQNETSADSQAATSSEQLMKSHESAKEIEQPSSSTDNASTLKTPPACLKKKNYIKLLHSASIKRSHKKERNRRKLDTTTDAQNLSDDGSLFGDNENFASSESDEDVCNNH